MNEDDRLRDEVDEMFRDEARKARSEAPKKWNIPPGYYDDKNYTDESDDRALSQFLAELFQIKRQKYPHGRRKK